MSSKTITVRQVIFTLLIFTIVFNGYLAFASTSGSVICLTGEGDHSGCSSVQNSKYGEIFGIKVIWFGLIAFIVLLVLYFLAFGKRKYDKSTHYLYMTFTSIGAIFAIYFIYVQKFILDTFCSSCLVIDSAMIIIYALSAIEFYKIKRR